jgi:hypothetical protein
MICQDISYKVLISLMSCGYTLSKGGYKQRNPIAHVVVKL